MTLNHDFITLISHSNTLNKMQCKILDIASPPNENFVEELLNKEISRNDANRLMLLKGKLALKAQDQIIKNYEMVLEFNNIKTTSSSKTTPPPQEVATKSTHINIYCDGACSGNPGKAGSGLAVYKNAAKPILYYGKYLLNGTNNRAELNALYQALLLASEMKTDEKVIILSDSKYSIDCISTWAYGWKKNNWTKKSGEIKNLELIKNTHNLYEQIKTTIILKHVKGHAGIEGNELADRMALHAIKAQNDGFEVYEYESVQSVL